MWPMSGQIEYQVNPSNPVVAVTAGLMIALLAASTIPVLRAFAVDPQNCCGIMQLPPNE